SSPSEPLSRIPPCSWDPSLSRGAYSLALSRLKNYLFAGDTYQINYTFRLSTSLPGSPRTLFENLVEAQGAHYSAFVDTGSFALCSASPELFFSLDGERLESRPMKGTAKRGLTSGEDRRQARALRESAKNRAENVMIVDMIRNDMGRVAIPGTVEAGPLFDVERYPTVWQMVSTVTARTRSSVTDILTALFPCASITGAPKPRTMAIIAAEETTPRRIYTGSIGYLAPGRQAQFNVAIRTVLVDRETLRADYGVGGGIVWDSETENEYDECWLKARILTDRQPAFELLETIRWTPEAGYFLLERHLQRALDSADYFDIPLSRREALSALHQHEATLVSGGAHRIRLLVARDGTIRIESVPLAPADTATPVRVRLASKPVDPANRFLYHKTTHRAVYEEAKSGLTDCDDVLLWNPAGELTESTIANIVVEREGERITPPVGSGLLQGVYRAELLEQGKIREAIIRTEDLFRCGKIYLISSVREWREATLLTASR
ncbi:MAG: aminodeoxychorismate synthase component I, partial [bacterium]